MAGPSDLSALIPKEDNAAAIVPAATHKQSNSNDVGILYHAMASKKNDIIQASLQILQKKRDELYKQQRILEDEIARREMNIQTCLLAGEENFTSKVESVIEACNLLCSSQNDRGATWVSEEQCPPQTIKRRRLSEAVLSLSSPCQELDEICSKNCWILPRYFVYPSFEDGKFQASITIHGMDFVCTDHGDLKSSPHEARNSAADHMLKKLHRIAGQSNDL